MKNNLHELIEVLKAKADNEGHLYQWEDDFKKMLVKKVKAYSKLHKITFWNQERIETIIDTITYKYYIKI